MVYSLCMSENTTPLPALAQLLHDAAVEKGLNSRAIAATMKYSAEHVRRWLNGTTVPTDDVLQELCELLHVPVKRALKLAAELRREYILPREALKDPQFGMLTKIWALMDTGEQAKLFNYAVAIKYRKGPDKAMAAASGSPLN